MSASAGTVAIHVLNHEGSALPSDELDALCHALHTQVHTQAGPAWGVNATVRRVRKISEVPSDGYLMICQQSIDVPGAAGYHYDPKGRPTAIVSKEFVDGIGMIFSVVASHEVLEMVVDPTCNRWENDYLVEIGDPVERATYLIGDVLVSDFATPNWFDPKATNGFDHLGLVSKPFELLPGGYATTRTGGKVHQVYGSEAAELAHLRKVVRGPHTRAARIAALVG